MVSIYLLAMYPAFYRSSLSSSDFMARAYLAAIRVAPSDSSVLRMARKVLLTTGYHISAFLASIILGQCALRSFDLMISVYRRCGGPANHVDDCLVSLRYPRKIVYV